MLAPPEKLLPAIDKAIAARGVAQPIKNLLGLCRARIDADSAWPSHQEELSRKALDAAHSALTRFSTGLDERPTAIAALVAIIDTTAGLIDREAMNQINEALVELRK